MKKIFVALLFAFIFAGCATEIAVQSEEPYSGRYYINTYWYWDVWYHYPYNYWWGYHPYSVVPYYYYYRPYHHYNYYDFNHHHRYNSPMPPPRKYDTPLPRDTRKYGNTRKRDSNPPPMNYKAPSRRLSPGPISPPVHERSTYKSPPQRQNPSPQGTRRDAGNTRQTGRNNGSRTNRK